MEKRWPTMWSLNNAGCQEMDTSEYVDPLVENTKLELEQLPTEILDMIFSYLRPADLVAVAECSSIFESIVRSTRLWRKSKLQLSGNSVRSFLLQLELAPEVRELKIEVKSPCIASIASNYDGPIPHIRTLSLSLSELSTGLSAALLDKFGQKSQHVNLDLSHGPLEPPRYHLTFMELLSNLPSLEAVTVRIDSIKDIIILNQMELKIVDLDIHRLQINNLHLGQFVGFQAAKLITSNSSHLQTLKLPTDFDGSLCRVAENCKNLRTLACSVWTLPEIVHLKNLHTLILFPPYSNISVDDVQGLIAYARRSRDVLANLREIRFLKGDADNVMMATAATHFAQAFVCLLLILCENLEELEVEWDVGQIASGDQAWFNMTILNNASSLREMRLHGNVLWPHHYFSLSNHCSDLEVLDMRQDKTADWRPGNWRRELKQEHFPRLANALTLLQKAIPRLTFFSDGDVDEGRDWHCYPPTPPPSPPPPKKNTNESESRHVDQNTRTHSDDVHRGIIRKLFLHTHSLSQWAYVELFPSEISQPYWRYATLDSSVWSNRNFTSILRMVPALGLLDCRNREVLSPGRKGNQWFNAVANGPSHIEAFRIRAVLVSAHLWKLMVPTLLRIGQSLRRLELDFRGKPYRDWRSVLCVLQAVPHLQDLVLRGSFEGDRPVSDWLHGRVQSLTSLDLRDCLLSNRALMPAFVESLVKLFSELRGTLQAVALPPLPFQHVSPVLRVLGSLTNLREVALHANELECLRQLTSLRRLELYGDRGFTSRTSVERLASNLRKMGDTLNEVERLTIPIRLITSQAVQEALFDVMPRLRRLEIIDYDGKHKICAQGPECKTLVKNLY